VGDVEVKKKLSAALNAFLDPIRERRAYYAARPKLVDEILAAGAAKVRPISQATVNDAREAMGLGKAI
jgi:tryptophanyl-tRNA synthetase